MDGPGPRRRRERRRGAKAGYLWGAKQDVCQFRRRKNGCYRCAGGRRFRASAGPRADEFGPGHESRLWAASFFHGRRPGPSTRLGAGEGGLCRERDGFPHRDAECRIGGHGVHRDGAPAGGRKGTAGGMARRACRRGLPRRWPASGRAGQPRPASGCPARGRARRGVRPARPARTAPVRPRAARRAPWPRFPAIPFPDRNRPRCRRRPARRACRS